MNKKLLSTILLLVLIASFAAASGSIVNESISLKDIVDGHAVPSLHAL